MKMIRLVPLFALLLVFSGCGENQAKTGEAEIAEEEYQDPEEAMGEWEAAWNSNDPQQLFSRTAEDAVLVLNGVEVAQDSIQSFLQNSGSAMSDLQMQSLGRNSTERMAYDTGTYSHGYINDTTTYQGTYTFVWEREENDPGWKVKVMNISNVHPEYGAVQEE